MIASTSGIRGILNQDLTLAAVNKFASNFAMMTRSNEILIARDTRKTGEIFRKTVSGSLLAAGANIVDYGVISTPALFRESLKNGRPAIMITASHNPAEWNGLKFIVEGKGINQEQLSGILDGKEREKTPLPETSMTVRRHRYDDDLVDRLGEGALEGTRVALDLGGGAAANHAPAILRRLGCDVVTVNDALGIFTRTIDPTVDSLGVVQKIVKQKECDLGLAFDCDGDRLVILDADGIKRSGDYMLTLALREMLSRSGERKVVVSVDTTQAVDEVVEGHHGSVIRSRVGETNVVRAMVESGATLGGEGSSGGLIDTSFNYCRDSMVAATAILRAIREKGRGIYSRVRSYHQARIALSMSGSKATRGIAKLQRKYPEAESIDGVKVRLSRKSWVLVRPSGTEDVVRISAEATSPKEAGEIAETFRRKLKELSR